VVAFVFATGALGENGALKLGDTPCLIALIAPLYGIEKVARESGLSAEARKELRQMNAPAMLDRLHRRLIELEPGRVGSPVLQKSPLGQAIRYTLGQWEALVRYLDDGRYEIDTNLVENAIRPTCIGKKNWLFIGMRTPNPMVPTPVWRCDDSGFVSHNRTPPLPSLPQRSGSLRLPVPG
jgi:hypothetical protein